jgi:hypothetical protein
MTAIAIEILSRLSQEEGNGTNIATATRRLLMVAGSSYVAHIPFFVDSAVLLFQRKI